MRASKLWRIYGGLAVCLGTAAGCTGDGGAAQVTERHPTEPARAVARQHETGVSAREAAPTPERWAVIEAHIQAHVDGVDRALRRVPALSRSEQAALRRDVNAVQTARAQQLGVRAGDAYPRLVDQGRLVRLADTTDYWVVRDLDYSVPYVTPDTEAVLEEVGRRFHAKLDSLELPRFRLVVNSVLRTAANQRALRRSNPNAAQGVSAHEFGTTLDVAYRRFAPPAGAIPELAPAAVQGLELPAELLYRALMIEAATQRAAELQAVLGRVLHEMRQEGKLLVMMERSQTVYHMTVARRYPARPAVLAAE